jgi:branched-chain amino acid transport system permease protein
MNSAVQLYATTLLVYLAVNLIASWALDIQFGVTGVLNFGFILFQSAGAYTAALLSLGPARSSGGFQEYLGGWQLPFPLPIVGAMVVGAILGWLVGWVGLRRLRGDFQAVVLLVVSVVATLVVESLPGFLNGDAGLSLVPKPLLGLAGMTGVPYAWAFVGFSIAVCGLVALLVARLVHSPYGRVLRAVRENDALADAMGRSSTRARMEVFVLGGALAALSGALLVEFTTAWAPSGWLYPETFVYFTIVIIGGRGSLPGVAVGAALIAVAIQQAVQLFPIGADATVLASLQWVVIGLLTLGFLWWRPQGLIPERVRRFGPAAGGVPPGIADVQERVGP